MDQLFRALSDPIRREVLRLPRANDLSAGDIADRLPIAKSTLSGHLNILKEANLVTVERSGTTLVYSLNIAAYEEIAVALMSFFQFGHEPVQRPTETPIQQEGMT